MKKLTLIREVDGIEEYRLEANGLTVLLYEEHSAPTVTVMVTYRAGSRNEEPGYTGVAHMLEHMMFKGTERYHKSKKTQIAHLLESSGAVLNANTGYDATNYYELIPSSELSLALDIEADRMRNARLEPEEFASEKHVVLNELERYYDSPVAGLMIDVWKTAFREHPYHHPVIGWRSEVRDMPVEKLREFYDVFYWPDNAVLSIIGDFDKAGVLKEILSKFAPVPASPRPVPEAGPAEPAQTEKRHVRIQRNSGSEFLIVAHRIPEVLHPDSAGLDIIGYILGSGKTSRLYRGLVQTGLAAAVEAGPSGTRDPGLFTTLVTLSPSATHEEAEAAVLEIYRTAAREGFTEEELERAKSQIRAAAAFARDGTFSIAGELSFAIAAGDWTLFSRHLENVEKTTLDELRNLMGRYLSNDEAMTTGYLISAEKPKDLQAAAAAHTPELHQPGTPGEQAADSFHADQEEPAPEKTALILEDFSDAPRKTRYAELVRRSENEFVRVWTLPTQAENIVTLAGSLSRAGTAYSENPLLAALTASMLDKGTELHDKFQMAALLEDRGAQISFAADQEYVRFQARCLEADVEAVIGLIAEQLRRPAFPEEEFGQLREQEIVRLRYAMSSTASRGFNRLMEILFPEGHPYHAVDFEKQLEWLEKTTVEDVRRFHKDHYGSQELRLAAVGSVDAGVVAATAEKAFSGWGPKPVPAVRPPELSLPGKMVRESVIVPGKGNIDVLMGHPALVTRGDDDYLPLYAAVYILGGDFTARLSSIVRDKYGLTYAIRSGLMGITDRLQGAWLIHMIINTPLLERGISRTLEELRRFREDGISEAELRQKKRTIAGRFQIGLATTRGLAEQILSAEELGLGVSYLDRFPRRIYELETGQVNQAIRRYLNPEQLAVLTAGDVPSA